MKVREIVSIHIRQISSSAMLIEAVDRMKSLDVAILPVVENGRIVGTITERDIASKAMSGGLDLRTTPVRNVMTPGVVCCSQEDEIEEAIHILETNDVSRLIVLDPYGQAVGVLSADDLAAKAG